MGALPAFARHRLPRNGRRRSSASTRPAGQWVTQDFHGATRTAVDSLAHLEAPGHRRASTPTTTRRTVSTAGGSRSWATSPLHEARALPGHRDQRADASAGTQEPVPAVRRAAAAQAWSHVASGAHMVEYWHWHSLHYGQETYWRGCSATTRAEPSLRGGDPHRRGAQAPGAAARRHDAKNRVAILHSVDSHSASSSCRSKRQYDKRGRTRADYLTLEDQLHRALYRLNVGADFVFAEQPDFSGYDVLIVPPLYVASDALLQQLGDFAKAGGHVLLTLQERLHERVRHRAVDARAGTACARRRLLLPGVLEPQGSRCR